MQSNKRLNEILIETKSFEDLEIPTLSTDGNVFPYYIHAERLVQDDGKFKEYGHSASLMINHAVNMMKIYPTFKEAIYILAEQVDSLFPKEKTNRSISGGQRRDWLFSGPIAHVLGLPHIGLYKQKNGMSDRMDKEKFYDGFPFPNLTGLYDIHIVDLITVASSCYRIENDKEKGWIPMLRNAGVEIYDLLTVVDRMEGGRKRLISLDPPINLHASIFIDEEFISANAKKVKRDLDYIKNPSLWVKNYLRENGALFTLENFNPQNENISRAKKFIKRYGRFLQNIGRFDELNNAVQKKYGINLNNIGDQK